MEYLDWLVRIGFLGMAVWFAQMYFKEKGKRHAPGKQTVIWEELSRSLSPIYC